MDIAVDNGFNLLFKPEGSFRGSAVSPPVVKCKFSETGGSVYEIFLLVVFFAPFVLLFSHLSLWSVVWILKKVTI